MQVLHIGTEKTGTKQLQNFLKNNAEVLKELYGIEVRTSKYTEGSSSDLINCVSNTKFDDLPDCKVKLETLSWLHKRTLISSEHFSSRLVNEYDLLNLRRLLNNTTQTGKIVIYIKSQDQLLMGMYAEWLKTGRSLNELPPTYEILNRYRYGIMYFDYLEIIKLWEKVFVNYSIVVRKYDRKLFLDRDICKDFISNIYKDVELSRLQFNDMESNRTLSPEILLCLNRFFEKFPHYDKYKVIGALEKHDPYPKGTFLDEEGLLNFKNKFSESNDKIREKYGIDLMSTPLDNTRYIDERYNMPDENFNNLCVEVVKELEKL